MESWTEIRCPACVELGWYSSRLLLKVRGKVKPAANVIIQIKCIRCKSVVEWTLGTPFMFVIEQGPKNHKRQTCAFE